MSETRDYLSDDPGMVSWAPTLITCEQLRIDPADLTRFLARLAVTGNVAAACKVAKVARATVYRLREDVSEFRTAWENAIECSRDVLRREAFRRAVEGVPVKIVYSAAGEKVAEVLEYSDQLLKLLLQAHCPEFAKTVGRVEVNQTQQTAVAIAVGPTPPPLRDEKDPATGKVKPGLLTNARKLGALAEEFASDSQESSPEGGSHP